MKKEYRVCDITGEILDSSGRHDIVEEIDQPGPDAGNTLLITLDFGHDGAITFIKRAFVMDPKFCLSVLEDLRGGA